MNDSVFTYDKFDVSHDRKEVKLFFTSNKQGESFSFCEVFRFAVNLPDTLETYRLLRALHIATGISYYKLFVNSEIEHPYAMSTRECSFWNTVFTNGLGEFLYINKISRDLVATFGPQEGHDSHTTSRSQLDEKALLGIGGGKDSIVAGELLKAIGMHIDGFVLATGDAAGQATTVATTMRVNCHKVERSIDKLLIELQKRSDAFKGHIPISLIFAITGSLLAVAAKHSYVVVANEASSSIPRVHWEGDAVNHQWSKSFEFEKLMQDYLSNYVSTDLVYFSAIRPLSSVAVAKIFANHPAYFTVFTSDNYAFRVNADNRPASRWSLQSAKSLSSFILLSAWLSQEQLLAIFERNFLDEASLEPLFLSLLGLQGEAPLDCVGTPEELRASLNQALLRGVFSDSLLMKVAIKNGAAASDRVIAPTVESFLHLASEQAFPQKLQQPLLTKITEDLS